MKINYLISFLFISLLLASCRNKNNLNLSETNCREEVPVLGNFNFVFDKNLVNDSSLNRWLDDPYIEFEPAIKGKFSWRNANELVFSPSSPLKPATKYLAKFTKELVKKTKFKIGSLEDIHFHTPYLTISQTNGLWVNPESLSSNIVPEVILTFNYNINPKNLTTLLSLKNGSDKLEFQVITQEVSSVISLRINNLTPVDKDFTLNLEIEKGLIPEGGLAGTSEEIKENIFLSSPFNLIISSTEAEHDGITGTARIYTSQRISSEINLQDYIIIEPTLKFKTSITDDGLVITSDQFDLSKSYQVAIKKGLKGMVGGTLKEDYTSSLLFGKLEPSISFINAKGIYLAGKGKRNLEVQINSVEKVKVVISKIYENNILNALRNGYYPASSEYENEYYEYSEEGSSYGSEYDYAVGDIVYEKEFLTKNLPKRGASRLFHFDFPDALKDFKGMYHIRIASEEEYYVNASSYISLSDLGIIARASSEKVYVFVNSIGTTNAVSGAAITLYGNNNQKIGSATTNGDGYGEIKLTNKNIKGFKPAMIVVKTGNDFSYMTLNSTMVETSKYDIGGVRNNSTGLRAFVYGDRDIYRPGEKINFSAIIRNQEWHFPGSIPIKIKVLLPNGKDLKSLKKSVNDQGSVEASVELSPAAVSGIYTIEIYTSNDVLLASKTVMVEEFMPDRIKVKADLDKAFYSPGDSINLKINATNFFGPPAANRNYECEIQVHEKTFSSKNFPKFDFSLSQTESNYENVLLEGVTDINGNASKSYLVPNYFKDRGVLQTNFYTTVFDESGRPVSRASTADIFTQNVFYGISDNGYGYNPLNQPVKFNIIALNKDDKVLSNAKAKILVIKNEYKTVLSRSGSYYRYESQLNKKTMEDKDVIISGSSAYFQFVPRSPGNYEIRIAAPGSNTYITRSFYSYGRSGEYGNSFEVNREGNIDIETDRVKYESGSSARILFKTPFNGKMLVTIEGEEILEYHYLDVKNRAASISIQLNEKSIPNVYITATLIKPHAESEMPLTVAHGFKPILVEELSRKIPVKIISAKSARSRTKQKVTVKAIPGCKVTLAAVDEGILQLTNYKTPDPFNFFYSKKALEIDAFDIYPLLLPEIKNAVSFTGGDGYNLTKRVNPLPNKRVKLVANWSGITDAASGTVTFDIDIPQFSGEIRLMAVAYKDENFGSAEEKLKVADPVVISTALPRFLSPGDTVIMPVTISNTTANTSSGKVILNLSGGLVQVSKQGEVINLKPNSETTIDYKIVAGNNTGLCKVSLTVNAMGERFLEETDMTIRPTTSLQKRNQNGTTDASIIKKLNLGASDFIASSVKKQFVISRSPILEFADQLNYLVQYPYGCTEQTISSAFPQLYYGDLADMMNIKDNNKAYANYNVQEAIRKIMMRQLYSGAVTLWDGEGSENWWTTTYSAHFLLEAKKSGFEVDGSAIDKMLDYLKARVKSRETIGYFYNRNENKQIAPKEVAYSLFVLSMAGKPDIGTMNYYKQNSSLLALDSRYLLSAAYAISGDKAKFWEMLPRSFSGEVSVKASYGSFYSDVRDEGIALYAVLEVDPGNAQVALMASHISNAFKTRKYLSTQERAFGLLALGKMARESAGNNATAVIKIGEKVIGNFTGKTLTLDTKQLIGNDLIINTSGKGKLYYFIQTEGISATGNFKEEDNYIKVRKQFFDRNGNQITGNSFKQNDLIVVGISIEKSYSSRIENIVITDMLPAGFEIENPRIKEIPGMNWIKNDSYPIHRDMRDDRINLFIDLNQPRQTYYYAVRAVSLGVYKMGPIMADAMYFGEMHSYNGAGIIKIVKK